MTKLFRIIIPIYDLAEEELPLIDNAVLSVLNQTIGINQIDVTLIDSTKSAAVQAKCSMYCRQHPEIHYSTVSDIPSGLYQTMNDVSSEYYAVLDYHNEWISNAFSLIHSFFTKSPENIDILTFKMKLKNLMISTLI